MTKTKKPESFPKFAFHIYQNPNDPSEYAGEFIKDGRLKFEIKAWNSYEYVSTILEAHLRLAVYE
jgi:hypothetical protein